VHYALKSGALANYALCIVHYALKLGALANYALCIVHYALERRSLSPLVGIFSSPLVYVLIFSYFCDSKRAEYEESEGL
jgi:hypothetical protein